MKLNQIVIVSNIAEKQNYNPIVFLPGQGRVGQGRAQGRAGRKKFDESFFEQGRTGQGRAKKCALWPSLIPTTF